MELFNAVLEVNDWQENNSELAIHNKANAQSFISTSKSTSASQSKLKPYLWKFPNLSYLQTDIHRSSKARSALEQSHRSKAGSEWFPGPQASPQSPAHCTQFHRKLNTVKLKVWGRSTTKPSLWKWAVRALTKHSILAFRTSWQYPKMWHMCFKF